MSSGPEGAGETAVDAGGQGGEGNSARDMTRLARIASAAVLILAMWAFGMKDHDGVLEPDLAKIPAILIVYLLVEVGIEVGAHAHSAGEKATKAAATAGKTLTEAEKWQKRVSAEVVSATNALGEASRLLNEHGAQFAKISGAGSALLRLTPVAREAASNCGTDEAEIYSLAANAVKVWSGAKHFLAANPELTKRLLAAGLRAEFASRVVDTPDRAAAFLATDSAFCELSEHWLKAAAENQLQAPVVYALTTLTPAQFFMPEMFWSNGTPDRAVKLLEFRQAVGDLIARFPKVTYRRTTVFKLEPNETERALVERFRVGLDAWWVREYTAGESALDPLPRIAREFSRLVKRQNVHPQLLLDDDVAWRRRIGDSHYTSLKKPSEPAILAALANTLRVAIGLPVKPDPEMEAWLRAEGLQPLRQWYCERLHNPTADETVASLCCVSPDGYREAQELLSVSWDGQAWPTFDLLLLGTQGNEGKEAWTGAAVSDLDPQYPACLVQLVFDERKLGALADLFARLSTQAPRWSISAT